MTLSRPALRRACIATAIMCLPPCLLADAQPKRGAKDAPPVAAQADPQVVARFDTAVVTREQLVAFLLHTRGLDALLNLMQLEMARELAKQEGIAVTEANVREEKQRTLEQAFAGQAEVTPEQYDDLLRQLLARQQLSETEFNVVMETNATLRALATPRIAAQVTDEGLRRAFNLRYGEQVRVRHIALANLAEVAGLRRRLDAGEDFAKLATELSQDPQSKSTGGELFAFSINSDLPQAFKEAAFGLEVGQVSDPVEAGGFFHLVRLEERIEPRAVKFEDVRAALKEQIVQEQSVVLMTQTRRRIAQMIGSGGLQVNDPILAEQLQQRLAAIQPQPLDPEELKRQMEQERPSSGPTTASSAPK